MFRVRKAEEQSRCPFFRCSKSSANHRTHPSLPHRRRRSVGSDREKKMPGRKSGYCRLGAESKTKEQPSRKTKEQKTSKTYKLRRAQARQPKSSFKSRQSRSARTDKCPNQVTVTTLSSPSQSSKAEETDALSRRQTST